MAAVSLTRQQPWRLPGSVKGFQSSEGGILVNRVLMPETTKKRNACPRCSRAQKWQQATLAQLKRGFRGRTLYIVKNYPEEIAGEEALAEFTRPNSIWQLA